jgi:hypothetical protein
MSWVWNVMLSFSDDELWDDEGEELDKCPALEAINAWIPDGKLVDLTKPTFKTGAGNGMEAQLFGGGFKHFEIEKFISVVEAQEWKNRAGVQLWVKGEEDGTFTLVKLRRKPARKAKGKRDGA